MSGLTEREREIVELLRRESVRQTSLEPGVPQSTGLGAGGVCTNSVSAAVGAAEEVVDSCAMSQPHRVRIGCGGHCWQVLWIPAECSIGYLEVFLEVGVMGYLGGGVYECCDARWRSSQSCG